MSKDYVDFECVHIAEADKNDPNEKQALAYADIDGYTADENEEGTVICRVWLLRQPINNRKDKGFIVDWHYNGYRCNKSVLELIDQAKKDLESYFDTIIEQVLKKAYDRYKLKWMLDHKHSIKELLDNLQDRLNNGAKDIYEAFDYFENTVGFGHISEIWYSKDIFRTDAWKNEDSMKELLDGMDYDIWYTWCRK